MAPATSTRRPGERFVIGLQICTISLILAYIWLHLTIAEDDKYFMVNAQGSYRLSPQGEFVLLNPQTLTWVVGEGIATPILRRLTDRSDTIRRLMKDTAVAAERLRTSLPDSGDISISGKDMASLINAALTTSEHIEQSTVWQTLREALENTAQTLRSESQYQQASDHLEQLIFLTGQLHQQAFAQQADILALKPNRAKTYFWNSPLGSSVEVWFFAIFGVLTNLLVNSADYLKNGNFRQSEKWVAYTKLVYGPVLAWILITAIAVGWLDLGEYQVGTYSLPLLAFFLGFYARRTVRLIDKLGEKLLGQGEKSVEQGPADIIAAHRAYIEQFMQATRPRTYKSIKQTAAELKTQLVNNAAMERELTK